MTVLPSPFSSSSTFTSVGHSSLETKSFGLTPVADNGSYSKAACTRERKVGRRRGCWLAGCLADPPSNIQRKQTRWEVSD